MKLLKELIFFFRVVLNLHEQPRREDHIGPPSGHVADFVTGQGNKK
jgi:hypothetical protein